MNLMEIGKKPEIQPTETADQMKNLPDTTDKWKQLAKEQGVDMFLLDDGWFANKYPRKDDHAHLNNEGHNLLVDWAENFLEKL